jgi:large subunit ribosomal protein L6
VSRIGKQPVAVPAGVNVSVAEGKVSVKGPKGELTLEPHARVKVSFDNAARNIIVERPDEDRLTRSVHGLTRTLLANMVEGVTKGYERKLIVIGLGYKAEIDKKNKQMVILKLGYANAIECVAPPGVTVEVTTMDYRMEGKKDNEKVTAVVVKGTDKQKVGQFAADVRSAQPSEPYQGKGIRYDDEVVRRKEGKSKTG